MGWLLILVSAYLMSSLSIDWLSLVSETAMKPLLNVEL